MWNTLSHDGVERLVGAVASNMAAIVCDALAEGQDRISFGCGVGPDHKDITEWIITLLANYIESSLGRGVLCSVRQFSMTHNQERGGLLITVIMTSEWHIEISASNDTPASAMIDVTHCLEPNTPNFIKLAN